YVDPHLPTTFDVSGHGDTRGFDLPVRHIPVLKGLDSVVTERDLGTALRPPLAAGVELFTVLSAPGDEHGSGLRLSTGGSRGCLGGLFSSRGGRSLGCGGLLAVTTAAATWPVVALTA